VEIFSAGLEVEWDAQQRAQPRAVVSARDDGKVKRHLWIHLVAAAHGSLHCAVTQVETVWKCAGYFGSQTPLRRKLFHEWSRGNQNASPRANADITGGGAARKQNAAIQSQFRFVGNRFLQDTVQKIIFEARAQSAVGITSRNLNVQSGRERRVPETLALFQKIVLDVKVEIAKAGNVLRAGDARTWDRDERIVNSDLNSID